MNKDGTTTCPACKTKQKTKMQTGGPPKLQGCQCGHRYHPRLRTR